ncbi:uncharacterized protein LOC134532591 [Bacillus rossius redtenbacheri]|uniref:uncharacterized protein LOC134532591 n=1 Tax=Bacillus rossius redtenbacheri TaxID=93214 RepID=UPI002FDD68F3
MLFRLTRPALKTIVAWNDVACVRARQYHPPAAFKQPTMDDLPVPQGSWQAAYDAKQRKYNIQLISGILVFAFTVGFVAKSDMIDFNFSRPELPTE